MNSQPTSIRPEKIISVGLSPASSLVSSEGMRPVCKVHGKPIRLANLRKRNPNKTVGCADCRSIRDKKRSGLRWAYRRSIKNRTRYLSGQLYGFELFERITGFQLQETNG